MYNMEYCMCENTLGALNECLRRIDRGMKLTDMEADCFRCIFETALQYCYRHGIVSLDEDEKRTVYHSLEEHANSLIENEDDWDWGGDE